MRRTLYGLLIIATIISLSSCYPTIYFPDRANTPGFRQRGEAKITAAIKMQSSDTANTNIIAPAADAAYAITKHIGVIASYRSVVDKVIAEHRSKSFRRYDTSFGGRYDGSYFEAGAGYFTTFAKVGQFEVYGGSGLGTITRGAYTTPQYNFDTKYYKIFLQPALNIMPGKGNFFKVGAGFRLTMIDYYEFNAINPDTKYKVTNSDPNAQFKRDITTGPFAYFEPFINLEVGYKFIKFNAQFGGSGGISNWSRDLGESPYCSLGLVFHYAPRYFK